MLWTRATTSENVTEIIASLAATDMGAPRYVHYVVLHKVTTKVTTCSLILYSGKCSNCTPCFV